MRSSGPTLTGASGSAAKGSAPTDHGDPQGRTCEGSGSRSPVRRRWAARRPSSFGPRAKRCCTPRCRGGGPSLPIPLTHKGSRVNASGTRACTAPQRRSPGSCGDEQEAAKNPRARSSRHACAQGVATSAGDAMPSPPPTATKSAKELRQHGSGRARCPRARASPTPPQLGGAVTRPDALARWDRCSLKALARKGRFAWRWSVHGWIWAKTWNSKKSSIVGGFRDTEVSGMHEGGVTSVVQLSGGEGSLCPTEGRIGLPKLDKDAGVSSQGCLYPAGTPSRHMRCRQRLSRRVNDPSNPPDRCRSTQRPPILGPQAHPKHRHQIGGQQARHRESSERWQGGIFLVRGFPMHIHAAFTRSATISVARHSELRPSSARRCETLCLACAARARPDPHAPASHSSTHLFHLSVTPELGVFSDTLFQRTPLRPFRPV